MRASVSGARRRPAGSGRARGGRRARPGLAAGLCLVLAAAAHPRRPAEAAPDRQPAAPGPAGKEVQAGQLSKLPRQVKFVEADYPAEAVSRGLEADVVLLLDVDAEGRVTAAAVAEPARLIAAETATGPGTPREPAPAAASLGFEAAAQAAALHFRFEPAELAAQPTAVQITYRYKFRLRPVAAPGSAAPPPAAAPPGSAAGGAPGTPPPPPARAPVVNLSGVLKERGTRLPLAGVVITVFREGATGPAGFEATSDAAGQFRFFDLAPGEWKVHVETPGYFPFRTTEQVRPGEATTVTYWVERGDYNPFDVMVTAARPRKEVSRTVLNVTEIDKVPGTAGDPLAVVQNLAGVARSPFLSGQVVVRGAAPEDSRVFVDGIEVPLIYHFGGLRSVLPIQMLDSLEFYPGNFAPDYGRATGGVVDARTKELAPRRLGGSVDVSLLDAGLYLEAPLTDKLSLAVAGRRSYIGTVMAAAIPDDVGIDYTVAPRYYDYQLLASYRPSAAHELRAFVFASDDALELVLSNPSDFDPELAGTTFQSSETFQRALLSYRYVPNDRFENLLRVAVGRDRENDFFGQLAIDIDTDSAQLRDRAQHRLTPWLKLAYGADLLVSRQRGLVRAPELPKEGEPMRFELGKIMSSRFDQTEWSPAAFVEGELKLFDRWLLLPGLRVDYFERGDEVVVQPRLSTRLDLSERVVAKAGVGLYTLDPSEDETNVRFGNPDLKAERALHGSFGVEYRPWDPLTIDVTAFYKDLRNLVSRTDTLVLEGEALRPLRFDNRGRGKVYGAELLVRHEFSHQFAGWVAYTLSRSVRRDSGAAEERLFDYDQTHILTAVGTYAFARNWQLGGRFRLVSGNPRTPIAGAVFNADSDRYDAVYGPTNSDRNAAFHQLDLRIEKRWVYQSWMLSLYLDLQNLYNRANPEGLIWSYDYRQSEVQKGLPIFPILGLRAEF